MIQCSTAPLPLSWRIETQGKPGAAEAGALAEADGIVAGLVEWCRLLLRETGIIVDWEEGRGAFRSARASRGSVAVSGIRRALQM